MNFHAQKKHLIKQLHTQHLSVYDVPPTCFDTASSDKWLFTADSATVGSNNV